MIRVLRWSVALSLVLSGLNLQGPSQGAAQGAAPGAAAGLPAGSEVAGVRSPPPPGPTLHSSDGVRGPLLPGGGRPPLSAVRVGEVGWPVSPGLEYAQWTQVETQGPVQVYVLTARLDQPGLVLDQVSGPTVVARAPLSRWLLDDRAVAGVNGDFFDIGDTGAPFGVGVDRQRGLLHAPRAGWNTTFVIDSRGTARVLQDSLAARVLRRGRPAIGITNFNSPVVAANGIGLYTAAWGRTSGRRVVEGSKRLRQVVVRRGVVRSNRTRLSTRTRIRGLMLIGRGDGARRLRALRVGRRVRVQNSLTVSARVAVSGSVQLLRDGLPTAPQNAELHPRTAIGIDRDQRLLHLVVVDGRSTLSRGLTLLQLASLLQSLGDEEALNLDGGGSSTMIAKDTSGVVGLRNRPSDGQQRKVPNGLGFRYTPPRG